MSLTYLEEIDDLSAIDLVQLLSYLFFPGGYQIQARPLIVSIIITKCVGGDEINVQGQDSLSPVKKSRGTGAQQQKNSIDGMRMVVEYKIVKGTTTLC